MDARIWLPPALPPEFERAIKAAFTHANPDYYKKQRMGFAVWSTPRKIETWKIQTDALGPRLTIPRGGVQKLRELVGQHGGRLRFMDRTTTSPVEFPPFRIDPERPELQLYDYQRDAIEAALAAECGVIRAPTGAGKSLAALSMIAQAGERAVVIVRDGNLLEQWARVAQQSFGFRPSEIGIVRGGRQYRPGKQLTLALQQSLYAKGDTLDRLLGEQPFGMVVIDEVQLLAAATFVKVIDRFPCRYRVGFSADERRKDGKEVLIYDMIGPVVFEIERAELERRKVVTPVTVRLVETEFEADWYRDAETGDRDFQRLIDAMTTDDARNELLVELIVSIVRAHETPLLVFTHRREHAAELANRLLPARRIRCGLLLGGVGSDQERFAEDRARLEAGAIDVAVGTFNAIGQGINMPAVRAGVCATPIGSNRQFFGQVRGRICRASAGKHEGVLYYLDDRLVTSGQGKRIASWNDGRVETWKSAR